MPATPSQEILAGIPPVIKQAIIREHMRAAGAKGLIVRWRKAGKSGKPPVADTTPSPCPIADVSPALRRAIIKEYSREKAARGGRQLTPAKYVQLVVASRRPRPNGRKAVRNNANLNA